MSLPNFLIAGAQKAGTSWLARNLGQHPDVFIPFYEVNYFNIEARYAEGLDWYARWFDEGADRAARGEKTPTYFWVTEKKHESRFGNHLPNIHRSVHQALPEALERRVERF